MSLKDKLELFLITYNRKENLAETFSQIFADSSPIKDFQITIINNKSDDGTNELIEEYRQKFPNIKHIINNRNIGGNANAARAYELATKEYVWVLCDDDAYDFSHWDEVERAFELNPDAIIVTDHKTPNASYTHFILSMTFVPGTIWKTENITSTVMVNAYHFVNYYFPQLALAINLVNKKKKINLLDHSIVKPRPVPIDTTYTYTRGLDDEKSPNMSNTIWAVGVLNCLDLLKDKKLKDRIIEEHIYNGRKELRPSYLAKYNKKAGGNSLKNICDAFCAYSLKNKLKLIYYYILVNLPKISDIKQAINTFKQNRKNNQKSETNNKKINIPISFVADDIYAKYMGVTIQSIIANSKKNEYFTFYVFNKDLSQDVKDKLNIICGKKAVMKYIDTTPFQHKFDALKQKAEHITKTSYYKFVIPDLLPELDKIIYLDCDLVVENSLADFYNQDVSDYLMAAVEDVGYTYWCEKNEKLKLKFTCINSGVLLFNAKKCRDEKLSEELFRVAANPDEVGFGQDQPVFNYVCRDKIKFADLKYNVQDSFFGDRIELRFRQDWEAIQKARDNAVVLHWTGVKKPWKRPFVLYGEYFWKYYLNSPFITSELKNKYVRFRGKKIKSEFLSNLKNYKNKEKYKNKLNQLLNLQGFDEN